MLQVAGLGLQNLQKKRVINLECQYFKENKPCLTKRHTYIHFFFFLKPDALKLEQFGYSYIFFSNNKLRHFLQVFCLEMPNLSFQQA